MQPETPTPQQTVPAQPASGSTPPPSPAAPQPITGSKRGIPIWVKVIMGVAAALIILFVILFVVAIMATNAPKKVSDEFVKDLQANNATAAYGLASSGFKSTTSESDLAGVFSQASSSLQGKANVSDRKIVKNSGAPAEAIIIYTIDHNGSKKYVRVVLQEKSGWHVVNFRSSETPLDTSSDE